jgi:hypothetical protein
MEGHKLEDTNGGHQKLNRKQRLPVCFVFVLEFCLTVQRHIEETQRPAIGMDVVQFERIIIIIATTNQQVFNQLHNK